MCQLQNVPIESLGPGSREIRRDFFIDSLNSSYLCASNMMYCFFNPVTLCHHAVLMKCCVNDCRVFVNSFFVKDTEIL